MSLNYAVAWTRKCITVTIVTLKLRNGGGGVSRSGAGRCGGVSAVETEQLNVEMT